jgi:hypothetical protein
MRGIVGARRICARVLAWLACLASTAPAGRALAAEGDAAPGTHKPWWAQIFATAFAGDGVRFNNPYRLSTVLGSQAQSLSRTAAYADFGAGVAFGDPSFLAHGFVLRVSSALEGVPQSVMTPAYLVLHRWGPWGAYARVGTPLVLTPEVTWGLEGGAGGLWFFRAGIGLAVELVGDLFYGAGTRDVTTPTYPVLSAQGGLFFSWEAMP